MSACPQRRVHTGCHDVALSRPFSWPTRLFYPTRHGHSSLTKHIQPIVVYATQPPVPLPWPDCFHPTQVMTRCQIRNDFIIGNPWPNPKYQLEMEDGLLEDCCQEDAECKEALQEEHQPLTGNDDPAANHPDKCEASVVTLPLPSEYDESLYSCLATIVNDARLTMSHWFLKVSKVFCRLIKKVSHCVPCIHRWLDDEDIRDFLDNPIWGISLSRMLPPDTMPVISILDDLESVKQINNLWDFFPELDALKRYSSYHLLLKQGC
ncbi:hypothetical protein F5146DRAFT_1145152 [Armillaria mellea]|nr:hypothetical protein F5146DRAFT_1145152 [Armillaria mellea]